MSEKTAPEDSTTPEDADLAARGIESARDESDTAELPAVLDDDSSQESASPEAETPAALDAPAIRSFDRTLGAAPAAAAPAPRRHGRRARRLAEPDSAQGAAAPAVPNPADSAQPLVFGFHPPLTGSDAADSSTPDAAKDATADAATDAAAPDTAPSAQADSTAAGAPAVDAPAVEDPAADAPAADGERADGSAEAIADESAAGTDATESGSERDSSAADDPQTASPTTAEPAVPSADAAASASGAEGAPAVRGALAPPTADAPLPKVRRFGKRARVIEIDPEADAAPGAAGQAGEIPRDAAAGPSDAQGAAQSTDAAVLAAEGAARSARAPEAGVDRDSDGVELGEMGVVDAPNPRPAPRFDGRVLNRPEQTRGRPLVWIVWAVIALAVIALVVLLLTGQLGGGANAAAAAAGPVGEILSSIAEPTSLQTSEVTLA